MRTLAAIVAIAIPTCASAIQIPKARPDADPHMCEVAYDPNNVVRIVATVGDNVTIVFGKDEVVEPSGVALSDGESTHLGRTGPNASNVLYFKPKIAMPPQPIAIRTTKTTDNSHRDYQVEWSAIDVPPTAPVAIAAIGDPPGLPPKEVPVTCWSVRYLYPSDAKAEADTKARVAWRRKKDDDAEIALREASVIQKLNVKYVYQGDVSLAPSNIWDDGRRTEMIFQGRMPGLWKPSGDDETKDAQLTNVSIEDNGIVKVVGVYPLIRLRDGDRVLCIIRRSNVQAADPGTGTVSQDIGRPLKTDVPK